MDDTMITVGFYYKDELGFEDEVKSTIPVCDTTLETIFSQFKYFLQYCGFQNFNREYLLEDSLTTEEYDYIYNALDEYRRKKNHDMPIPDLTKIDDGILIRVFGNNIADSYFHIRRGSGSYLNKEDEDKGYKDYIKVSEYIKENDNLSLIEVDVVLLHNLYDIYTEEEIIDKVIKKWYPENADFVDYQIVLRHNS